MIKRAGWFYNELCSWHNPNVAGGFRPEGPLVQQTLNDIGTFLQRSESLVRISGLHEKFIIPKFERATRKQLMLVHTRENIRHIETQSMLNGDAGVFAPVNYHSFEAARFAVGACTNAISEIVHGKLDRAYCLIAPPGHHAEPECAMGGCLFNNVAIGIRNIQNEVSLKVMVVDWDVHHGNGTQKIFYNDPSVLVVSIHQEGLFPPLKGMLNETGIDKAVGLNLNIPLPAGTGHGAYLGVIDQIVIPATLKFRPDLIVVSAGLDASAYDHFGRMMCTSDTFFQMSKRMIEIATEVCSGRIVFCNEGGYSSWYLPLLVATIAATIVDVKPPEDHFLKSLQNLPGQKLSKQQQQLINQTLALHPLFH